MRVILRGCSPSQFASAGSINGMGKFNYNFCTIVDNKIQSPWSHSNCLIAAQDGVDLNGIIPLNNALRGKMKVQSGIVSAILPNNCNINQTING